MLRPEFWNLIRMDGGQWTPASRSRYNLRDTVARCTAQVLRTSRRLHGSTNYHDLMCFFSVNLSRCLIIWERANPTFGVLLTCFFILVCPGVPEVVDSNIRASGQCGDVERQIRELGEAVSGPAVLPQGLHTFQVSSRRGPDPEECAPLRAGPRPPHEALIPSRV